MWNYWNVNLFERSHEIMALFVLRKLILQMHMYSSPEPSLVAFVISTIISWAGSFPFGSSLISLFSSLMFVVSVKHLFGKKIYEMTDNNEKEKVHEPPESAL